MAKEGQTRITVVELTMRRVRERVEPDGIIGLTRRRVNPVDRRVVGNSSRLSLPSGVGERAGSHQEELLLRRRVREFFNFSPSRVAYRSPKQLPLSYQFAWHNLESVGEYDLFLPRFAVRAKRRDTYRVARFDCE